MKRRYGMAWLAGLALAAGVAAGGNYPGFEMARRKLSAIRTHLLPAVTATYDVGENTTPLRWRDGWFSDQLVCDILQADTITNEAGTGAPAFSQGLSVATSKSIALADDAFISSAEVTSGSIVYRFHNRPDTGFSPETSISNSIGWWCANAFGGWLHGTGIASGVNGTNDLGVTTRSWDDTYTDDLFLQRTTATEGIIHGQGVTGDDELRIQITNTSGQYDRWGFLFAPAPGQTASVMPMEVSSSAVHMPLGQTAHYATHAADDVITTNELWNGYTETTGTAVTLFTAVGNLGRRARIVNEDAGGDDITVTSAGGNILVQTITVAAGAVTLGFNADTAVDLVERGAGIECISDNTDWQCVPLGMGIN